MPTPAALMDEEKLPSMDAQSHDEKIMDVQSDDEKVGWQLHLGTTIYHPVGSCRMGLALAAWVMIPKPLLIRMTEKGADMSLLSA